MSCEHYLRNAHLPAIENECNVMSFGISSIRPTCPLCRRMMSLTLVHFSPVPWLLGFKHDQNGSGTAVFALSLVLWIEVPVLYPSLQNHNGHHPHTQGGLNLGEAYVPQVETIACSVELKMVWKLDIVWPQGCVQTTNLTSAIGPKEDLSEMNACTSNDARNKSGQRRMWDAPH